MIHICRSTNNQFFLTVFAKNGKKITTTETYTRKEKAYKALCGLLKIFGGKSIKVIDKSFKDGIEDKYVLFSDGKRQF